MSEKSNAMTVDELSELDELLASVDESAEPMDASEADGFMTAIQLLPTLPDTRSWLGRILSTNGKALMSFYNNGIRRMNSCGMQPSGKKFR